VQAEQTGDVDEPEDPLADRIEAGLSVRPLSEIEQAVAEVLFENKAGEWISYNEILVRMEAKGFDNSKPSPDKCSPADYKAARALGLLSSRMKENLLPSDIAGKLKPIEPFAARAHHANQGICYRLTDAGRKALVRVFGP
jgi:hypothetical protein